MIPCSLSNSGGPIPESIRTWGVLMAPALKMTSRAAVALALAPSRVYDTPAARLPSMVTLPTSASVTTSKFFRERMGCR